MSLSSSVILWTGVKDLEPVYILPLHIQPPSIPKTEVHAANSNENFLFIHKTDEKVREFINLAEGTLSTAYFQLALGGCVGYELHLRNLAGLQMGITKGDTAVSGKRGRGVGDDQFSYAYDPIRGLVWHNEQSYSYGVPCWEGDKVQCRWKEDNGTISVSFMRNDEDFGIAFKFQGYLAQYIPAISLAPYQCVKIPEPATDSGMVDLYGYLQESEQGTVVNSKCSFAHLLAFYGYYPDNYIHNTTVNNPTPFHWAVALGHKTVVEQMLQYSPQYADSQDATGYLPIHVAVLTKQYACLASLLSAKQPESLADKAGNTPIHVAARFGALRCALMLLRVKLYVSLINRANLTEIKPLDYAIMNGHALCADMLIRYGATLSTASNQIVLEEAYKHLDTFLLLVKHSYLLNAAQKELLINDAKNNEHPFLAQLLGDEPQTKSPNEILCNFGEICNNKPVYAVYNLTTNTTDELLYNIAKSLKLVLISQVNGFIEEENKNVLPADFSVRALQSGTKLQVQRRSWDRAKQNPPVGVVYDGPRVGFPVLVQ